MAEKAKIRVLVAMSGGVDSSVAAALLSKNKKYEVAGAFMKNWSEEKGNKEIGKLGNICTWKRDRRDALRVAAKLGIPIFTLDFEKEYREQVAEYMFREYEAGRTPNPDVLCNKYIKFGVWLKAAKKMGFEYLATGHYARIKNQKSKIKNQKNDLRFTHYVLRAAKDSNKDQTYFLHQLTQSQLVCTLFPIGEFTKPQVRALARKFQLPTAERPESMGICFVGEKPMKEFLQTRITQKKGRIILTDGTVVGEHDGLAFYTVGQRHFGEIKNQKLKIKNSATKPLYVIDKRRDTNELIVGFESDPLLYKKEVAVTAVNWISGFLPQFPLKCQVRLRHRQKLEKAKIKKSISSLSKDQKLKVVIEFDTPQRAVTPGQFAVFYKNGICLGGGVIK